MELPSYVLLTEAAAVLTIKLHTRHPFPHISNQTPFDSTDMGHDKHGHLARCVLRRCGLAP